MAVLTNLGSVQVWDLHDPSFQPRPVTPGTISLLGLEFSPNGKQLAVFGEGIMLLDLGDEIRVVLTFSLDSEWHTYGPVSVVEAAFGYDKWQSDGPVPVVDVEFSPDGRLLVCARGRAIWTWDLETGELLSKVSPRLEDYTSLPDFTHDGEKLFFIDQMRARFVKTAALKEGDSLTPSDFTDLYHGYPPTSAELSKDGQDGRIGIDKRQDLRPRCRYRALALSRPAPWISGKQRYADSRR